GRRSTLGKRVLCKQPRVRIPPSPPKARRVPASAEALLAFSSEPHSERQPAPGSRKPLHPDPLVEPCRSDVVRVHAQMQSRHSAAAQFGEQRLDEPTSLPLPLR